MNTSPVRIGVVGLGYWGPNIARNFDALPAAELAWCCDSAAERRESIKERFPGVRVTSDIADLLSDPDLDAVALATPVPTHAELSTLTLEAGKHCFVEKPLAQSVGDAERVL